MRIHIPMALMAPACVLAACGGTSKFEEDSTTDPGTDDTLVDTFVDTSTDTVYDTAIDTAADTSVDTAVDTAVDSLADPDAAEDVHVDPDVPPDTSYDTTPEIPPDSTCSPTGVLACDTSFSASNYGTGSIDLLDANACVSYTEIGPEIAWSFTATGATRLTLDLTGLAADLDLFLLGQTAGMCDPGSCLGHSAEPTTTSEHLERVLDPGQTAYVLVDGFNDAVSSFNLSVTCSAGEVCWNGVDDDGDGAADCGDTDCQGTPWCPEYCTAVAVLNCGDMIGGSTATAGTPDVISRWGCNDWIESGPEMVYSFSTTSYRTVVAMLSDHDPNLDVFVLRDNGAGCVSSACISADVVEASFWAEAYVTYYIVVDGLSDWSGPYTIRIVCG